MWGRVGGGYNIDGLTLDLLRDFFFLFFTFFDPTFFFRKVFCIIKNYFFTLKKKCFLRSFFCFASRLRQFLKLFNYIKFFGIKKEVKTKKVKGQRSKVKSSFRISSLSLINRGSGEGNGWGEQSRVTLFRARHEVTPAINLKWPFSP